VSGPIDLLVLLQLPGDSVGSPLLILAVILAGLAALAAETPHDTPREGHAWLALSVFPFHVYRSVPVTFSGRVGDGVGGGVGGGGGGDGGAGAGDGVDREGGRSGSGSGRTTTARDRVSREGEGGRATGADVDVRDVVVRDVALVVVVYGPVAGPSRFEKRPVSRRGKLAPVPRVPPSAVLRFRRSVRLGRSRSLYRVSRSHARARALRPTSSARHHGRLTSLSGVSFALSRPLASSPRGRRWILPRSSCQRRSRLALLLAPSLSPSPRRRIHRSSSLSIIPDARKSLGATLTSTLHGYLYHWRPPPAAKPS